MEFPLWFQNAIQRRLDHVSARIEHHPELRRCRDEEESAFQAMFSGVDMTQLPAFMEWEDKHHFKQSIMNEWLYLQGMRDGAQLVFALLADPLPSGDEVLARSKKTEPTTVQPEDGTEL
ncbi:hypothetical protein FRY98_22495 [Paenibacillus faecis]|uniref:Uncharacterized protein n=1 Tax=Paenibacillus faecis TaxID=862114 RepID=A0A5D0CM08_9BACL|nr:hypothetical protein [Paenibacillus faecis]TYA10580.1 hypothetical protein FRY98_22495 [Paenibacillus faecis]